MTVTSVEFAKGIIGSDDILTDGKPQIAFVGCSNAGKSSIINTLINRKDFVRSGSMPGRTKQIDFFIVNEDTYFVDLPGYGYAQLSPQQRVKLNKMMLWYLFEDINPDRKIVLIINAAIGAKKSDLEILDMIKQYNLNVIIVGNKVDLIKGKELAKKTKQLQEQFPGIILFSAKTKVGKGALLNKIFE